MSKLYFEIIHFDGLFFSAQSKDLNTISNFMNASYPIHITENGELYYKIRKDDWLVEQMKEVFYTSVAYISYDFNQDIKKLIKE